MLNISVKCEEGTRCLFSNTLPHVLLNLFLKEYEQWDKIWVADYFRKIERLMLNKLYDEKYQISAEMLEVSMQLDRKINRYMRMKKERICSGIK